VKFAVIVWTELMCALSRARSGDSAAAAGAAAITAAAVSARAKFLVNVISKLLEFCAGTGVRALNVD
jgi:hypothetical protein